MKKKKKNLDIYGEHYRFILKVTHCFVKQAQKRPKVFGWAQIISLRDTEQDHLTRLPIALPMRNVCRTNVTDPMRYLDHPRLAVLCVTLAGSFNYPPCQSL
jgi:hypothetical protein